jgi:hypothetical protein
MNKIIVLIAALFIVGCEESREPVDTGTIYNNVCIDGVTYVYFRGRAGYAGYGYMSVKLDKDSKVIPCSPPPVVHVYESN